jgi:LDH2 family malate/lactate/ureidoglycolate dehydrogenase
MPDETEFPIDVTALSSLTQACFERLGIRQEDALAVADVLIDSNLHGVPSHGFQRVPIYMRRVNAGLSGGTEHLRVVAESGALARMDAAHALGPAGAVKALDHGLALAGKFGVALVALGRSTHFGAAGSYSRRAAAAGFASIVMTNATKRMAPHGSADAFLGTNAVAIGIPLAAHDPFILDIATSIGAQGKITRAKQLNEQIPPGLAIDPQGQPTTDPALALLGSLLPVGGAKGSGLALAVSLFAVLLAEADCDDEMASLYNDFERRQNTGHVFVLIDPSRLGDAGDRADVMIDRLMALRPVAGSPAVRYPGQESARLARARRQRGVPITRKELASVADICGALGHEDLQERAHALLSGVGLSG